VTLQAEPGHTARFSACRHLLERKATAAPCYMVVVVCGTAWWTLHVLLASDLKPSLVWPMPAPPGSSSGRMKVGEGMVALPW